METASHSLSEPNYLLPRLGIWGKECSYYSQNLQGQLHLHGITLFSCLQKCSRVLSLLKIYLGKCKANCWWWQAQGKWGQTLQLYQKPSQIKRVLTRTLLRSNIIPASAGSFIKEEAAWQWLDGNQCCVWSSVCSLTRVWEHQFIFPLPTPYSRSRLSSLTCYEW